MTLDKSGNIYVADKFSNAIRVLRPTNISVVISSVVDAASQRADPISPGKIVVISGVGLGPAQLVQNQPSNGQIGNSVGGTAGSFNGLPAPVLYASATQRLRRLCRTPSAARRLRIVAVKPIKDRHLRRRRFPWALSAPESLPR